MGNIFHPDEPKQIMALFNFLQGEYVRYYGSLFYDGYPYGLNHLDEYLLRPVLFLFQSEVPSHQSLYYHARFLRLLYSLAIMCSTGFIVYKIVNNKAIGLLAFLLIGIAPLSITVSHFATGDIGVDLFTALCLLSLLFNLNSSRKKSWLFFCGISVGAAFSAKYNGLLLIMLPGMYFVAVFIKERSIKPFLKDCLCLALGALAGVLIFTPNLFLDFKTSVGNILANFKFIKNYNVPDEILAKSFVDRAVLSMQNNFLYIISSIGYTAIFTCFAGALYLVKKYTNSFQTININTLPKYSLLLAIAIFPFASLLISISGKYVVQPFHFSYLQIPVIVVCSILLAQLFSSKIFVLKFLGFSLTALLIFEFSFINWKENFFWRHEDNGYHAQNLPASIYDREAFYTHRSGKIRSLVLENPGPSVFRNHSNQAKGPDAEFWTKLGVAPLPQVANPIGKDWIFLNGPSFPRNERMIVVHGENYGKKISRFLVLPPGQKIAGLAVQSGSYATEATISIGDLQILAEMEAHQQKIISVNPGTLNMGGLGDSDVQLIPFTVSVPHNSLWFTVLSTDREKEYYTIFGGGQTEKAKPPEILTDTTKTEYFDALSRIRYLEHRLSWRIAQGKDIPMWEVALPAGRYTLTCEVDGLADQSQIAIRFEDAKGKLFQGKRQFFNIKKGIQRIEYSFSKPFAPYQMKFIISGIEGSAQMLFFKLTPDYRSLSGDFELWRSSGRQPQWMSRFE